MWLSKFSRRVVPSDLSYRLANECLWPYNKWYYHDQTFENLEIREQNVSFNQHWYSNGSQLEKIPMHGRSCTFRNKFCALEAHNMMMSETNYNKCISLCFSRRCQCRILNLAFLTCWSMPWRMKTTWVKNLWAASVKPCPRTTGLPRSLVIGHLFPAIGNGPHGTICHTCRDRDGNNAQAVSRLRWYNYGLCDFILIRLEIKVTPTRLFAISANGEKHNPGILFRSVFKIRVKRTPYCEEINDLKNWMRSMMVDT